MTDFDTIDGYLLFTDKNHDRMSGFRRSMFRHVVLLENDERDTDRWVLRQWRNGREIIRVILESDFKDRNHDTIRLVEAIKRGMLDVDMNGEADLDVRIMEVRIPQVRPRRRYKMFRANDLGYVKWRLGMSGVRFWLIRSPYKLYRFFEENGPSAIQKTAPSWSVWGLLWGSIRLMRKAA